MKVITLIGTRPEIIKLSRVMYKLDLITDHIIVHTGQNYDYELNKIFFDDLGIRKPDYFLEAASGGAVETIANVLLKVDEVFEKEKPDALLLLGDTNSGLGVISAKKRKIPIFHMEAGNRCFDQRVPEEINRKIIDHLSDINMPYSAIAREYLLREGIPPDQIIKTGSPMKEVLDYYMPKIKQSDALQRLGVEKGKYFVLSSHREENVDQEHKLRSLSLVLDSICKVYNLPIIFAVHPRTVIRIEKFGIKLNPLVQLMKPLGFLDYVQLQMNSFCVISDSGTISEESGILNFPAINIRDAHERPEASEEGIVIMTSLDEDIVLSSIKYVTEFKGNEGNEKVDDYNRSNVSDKVVKIILGYSNFVQRKVWYNDKR